MDLLLVVGVAAGEGVDRQLELDLRARVLLDEGGGRGGGNGGSGGGIDFRAFLSFVDGAESRVRIRSATWSTFGALNGSEGDPATGGGGGGKGGGGAWS